MKKNTIAALILLIASAGSISAQRDYNYDRDYDRDYDRPRPVSNTVEGAENVVTHTGEFAGDVVRAPFGIFKSREEREDDRNRREQRRQEREERRRERRNQ